MIFDADSIEIEDGRFAADLLLVAKLSGWCGYIDFRKKLFNQAVAADLPGKYVHKPWKVVCQSADAAGAAREVMAKYREIVRAYRLYMAMPEDAKIVFARELN